MKPTPQEVKIINSANLSIVAILISAMTFTFFVFAKEKPEYNPLIRWYNASGEIAKPGKIWMATVPITTATGQVVDISSAGFTSISSINIAGASNSSTITALPNCILKTNTLTSITFNTTVSNSAVLAILQGLTFPASTTGFSAHIIILGN